MKHIRYVVFLLMITMACSKSDDKSEPEPKPEVTIDPVAVALKFPFNNSECIEGVGKNANKNLVQLQWSASENDSYELVLENLSTNEIINVKTREHMIEVLLDQNTPYQWYVVSRMATSNKIAESERWKFYTSGEGISNYAPFPAELLSPEINMAFPIPNELVLFQWQSTDVDDDTILYDIYMGPENPPVEKIASDLTEPTFEILPETAGEWYWRVVAHDTKGNSSKSKVGNFVYGQESGIVSFEINENNEQYSADIDVTEKTIHLTLGNFNYEKLAPEIILKEGYSINPGNGDTFNFHDDLFYVVTDPRGNETVYTVVVESGQHEVRTFMVHNGNETYFGEVDQENATVIIQMGNFDYGAITPEIEVSDNANLEVSQVTQMNLKAPATFTVTSEIGTTKEYTVKTPIEMSRIYGYFRNGGFLFSDVEVDTGYKMFAGSTQYMTATNIQDRENFLLELIDEDGNSFPAEIFSSRYSHQHSYENSGSSNSLAVIIPPDLPGGYYSFKISEGNRSKSYPHRFEVVNDERVIRITEINKTDFSRGDTLIMKGVNLRNEFAVKSNGNIYVFNNHWRDITINEERTEMQLIFSTNVYGNLKSWGESNEKPLAIQTTLEGYSEHVNSNVIYFNVN